MLVVPGLALAHAELETPTPADKSTVTEPVTEVSGVGLPAIYVPLPIGNGEQAQNARPVISAGGGLLVADGDLTAAWVSENVPALLTNPLRLAGMARAAADVIPLDADEKLADMIIEAAAA